MQHQHQEPLHAEETHDIKKYQHRNLINSKYVFERKIGKGSFGCIYQGLNIITQEKVAIKYEATTCVQPTLVWESKILNHLSGIPGVVKLRYFGTESNKNIIVMDLFSHTLAEEVIKLKKTALQTIFNGKYESGSSESGSECETQSSNENSNSNINSNISSNSNSNNSSIHKIDYKYYLKDVLKYMISIVEIIEKVHEKGVIHRDIKPENFMISQSRVKDNPADSSDSSDPSEQIIKKVNIIDFGLSRIYIKEDAHISNKPNASIVGTMRYISTHIHEGNVYSRRDDIISILYVIIYLLKGKLPWCGLKIEQGEKRTKAEIVYEVKKITPISNLCHGLPAIFERMLTYAYKISFDEKPDYIYLKRLCKQELSADD
jgi:casein kinase I family protein HRR25